MIYLTTNNFEFEIDDIDKDLVLFARWYKPPKNRNICETTSIYNRQYLHIIIAKRMNLDTRNFQIDHIDRDISNNKRNNLREATNQENSFNKDKPKRNTTGYKGVYYFRRDDNFRAYIVIDKIQLHLGYFVNELDAAKAYNEAAIKYFGKFACLNEIN